MLINRSLLKTYAPYPKNYDLTEVMQYVDIAEKIYIIPLIGQSMYEELLEEVENNEITPENATLLTEAIYPLLGFAVAYEALPMTWASVTEVGIVKGHSDNSDSLGLKDMTYVSDHIKRQVQARGDYAIQWIKDRIDYYPLIAECITCKCSCDQNKDLYKPKTFQQLYSTNRICTDLK